MFITVVCVVQQICVGLLILFSLSLLMERGETAKEIEITFPFIISSVAILFFVGFFYVQLTAQRRVMFP